MFYLVYTNITPSSYFNRNVGIIYVSDNFNDHLCQTYVIEYHIHLADNNVRKSMFMTALMNSWCIISLFYCLSMILGQGNSCVTISFL